MLLIFIDFKYLYSKQYLRSYSMYISNSSTARVMNGVGVFGLKCSL